MKIKLIVKRFFFFFLRTHSFRDSTTKAELRVQKSKNNYAEVSIDSICTFKIVSIMKLSIVQQKQGNRYSASKLDTEMTKNSPSLCHLVQHKATAETKECCCPPSDDLKRCEKVKKNQKKINSTHAIRIKNEKYFYLWKYQAGP